MGKFKDLLNVTKYRKRFNSVNVKYASLLEKYSKVLEEQNDLLNKYCSALETGKELASAYKKLKQEVSVDDKNKSKGK